MDLRVQAGAVFASCCPCTAFDKAPGGPRARTRTSIFGGCLYSTAPAPCAGIRAHLCPSGLHALVLPLVLRNYCGAAPAVPVQLCLLVIRRMLLCYLFCPACCAHLQGSVRFEAPTGRSAVGTRHSCDARSLMFLLENDMGCPGLSFLCPVTDRLSWHPLSPACMLEHED
jgi:hypothetical protein